LFIPVTNPYLKQSCQEGGIFNYSSFTTRQSIFVFCLMRYYKSIILVLLVGFITFFSFTIYELEKERRELKEDLIELSKVKYGLFSVDEWKKILAGIITKKIEELDFSGSNRAEMKKKISAMLYKIIDDFEERFRQKNAGSILGILGNSLASSLGVFERVKGDIPKFTEQILDFLDNPENRKAIRNYVIDKLNQYADNTFSKLDYTAHDAVLLKYNFPNREDAINKLSERIEALDLKSRPYKITILAMALITITWVFAAKSFSQPEYMLLTLASLLLLLTGLFLPMIEIDARITSMSFNLLGETIAFKDQVLYYKSKSILEVVWLMFRQSRWDVLVVGVLVFLFSVLFPLAKQIASVIFIYVSKARTNKVIRFMVFKTGKWSMADVMVIAIFMSYIGFSGIITEQLKQIESIASSMEILTTNKSSLLTGFFFFTSFAIFSLSISQKIELQFGRTSEI
jgi:hypothetical protein